MRIVDLFILLVGTSIPLLKVGGKPAGNYGGISLPDELARVRKRKEDSASYLEQCGGVEFPDARRGLVNVLAFLDSSWPYSHRQAIMLNMLNHRLQNSGLRDTLFFVVNVDPYYRHRINDTSTEDEIEREAWLGVSPEEIEGFAEIDKTFESLAKSMNAAAAPARINVIQDNEDLGVWRTLGGSRDQVLVIDRCGKLTYQVIVPWSILHFPYVKAAILSTYNDEPCGPCDLHHTGDLDDPVEASSETIEETFGTVKDAGTLDVTATESEDLEISVEYLWGTSTLKVIEDTTKMDDITVTADPATESGDPIANETETMGNTSEESVNYRTETVLGVEETTPDGKYLQNGEHTDGTRSNHFLEGSRTEDASSTSGYGPTIVDVDAMDTTRITVTNEATEPPTTEGSETSSTVSTDFIYLESNDATTNIYDATTSDEIDIKGVDKTTKVMLRLVTTEVSHFEDDPAARQSVTVDSGDFQAKNSNCGTTAASEATTRNPVENVIEESLETVSDVATDLSRHFVDARGTSKMVDENTPREVDAVASYVPIRIIMHAPHFHVDTDSTRMHEYLVLKTGSTNTHGHLASDDATRLYRGPQDYQEQKTNSTTEEIEDKKWPMKNLIFNKDESTGLFGEVADYWRDLASPENYEDDSDETERPDDERVYQEGAVAEKFWEQTSSQTHNENSDSMETTKSTDVHTAEAAMSQIATEMPPTTGTDEFNSDEEETRHKLIAHYSKLLPWIYYVLDE